MNDHTFSAHSTPTVVVADGKPLSLLATAGVLHHAGMRCLCARTADAVMRACGLPLPPGDETLLAEVHDLVNQVANAVHTDRSVEPLRVDEPNTGASAMNRSTRLGSVDLIVWDVGDEVTEVLITLAQIRERLPELPAILLAESKWAGLEKKTEKIDAATRCLFKPIDPSALVAVSEPLLWMPALQSAHRQRGSRPSHPGWVSL